MFTCSEDLSRQSSFCCICQYPLATICEICCEKHLRKPSFHFLLPLKAREAITSEGLLFQIKPWLFELSSAQSEMRKNVDEGGKCQKRIEEMYESIVGCALDVKTQLLQKLTSLRSALHSSISHAIDDTSANALDYYTYNPSDPLSNLIWWNTQKPEALKVFQWRAEAALECVQRAWRVEFGTTVAGLETSGVDIFENSEEAQRKSLMDAIEAYRMENERLERERKAADEREGRRYIEILRGKVDALESEIAEMRRKCEEFDRVLLIEQGKAEEFARKAEAAEEKLRQSDDSKAAIQSGRMPSLRVSAEVLRDNCTKIEVFDVEKAYRTQKLYANSDCSSLSLSGLAFEFRTEYKPNPKFHISMSPGSIVTLQLSDSSIIPFKLDPTHTVASLKAAACRPSDYLVFKGKEMNDADVVATYGISDQDLILVKTMKVTVMIEGVNMMVVFANENDTVEAVLTDIARAREVMPERIVLKIGTKKMAKSHTLRSYNVREGSVIDVRIDCQIFVKTISGKTIALSVNSDFLVADVKNAIFDVDRVPPTMQTLAFRSKVLDDNKSLRECGVAANCTLCLTLNMSDSGAIIIEESKSGQKKTLH